MSFPHVVSVCLAALVGVLLHGCGGGYHWDCDAGCEANYECEDGSAAAKLSGCKQTRFTYFTGVTTTCAQFDKSIDDSSDKEALIKSFKKSVCSYASGRYHWDCGAGCEANYECEDGSAAAKLSGCKQARFKYFTGVTKTCAQFDKSIDDSSDKEALIKSFKKSVCSYASSPYLWDCGAGCEMHYECKDGKAVAKLNGCKQAGYGYWNDNVTGASWTCAEFIDATSDNEANVKSFGDAMCPFATGQQFVVRTKVQTYSHEKVLKRKYLVVGTKVQTYSQGKVLNIADHKEVVAAAEVVGIF